MINDRTPEQKLAAQQRAKEKLEPLGWVHLHGWIFMKNKEIYDLSAADLDRIEYIERNRGLPGSGKSTYARSKLWINT